MSKRIKVACVGDSITWGFLILNRHKDSYPAVLRSLLGGGFRVRNFGCNNAAATLESDLPYVLTRAYRLSRWFRPDVVVLMLGTNDSKKIHWNAERFRTSNTRIVESYRKLKSAPRLFLMLPPHAFPVLDTGPFTIRDEVITDEVIPIIREIAAAEGLPLIDINSVLCSPERFVDGVHPDKDGARLIARTVYDHLTSGPAQLGQDILH